MIPSKQFRKIAILAANAADEKKAEEILLLDMRKTSYGLSDFFLLMTANSQVHMKTLREAIEETVEKMNLSPLHREGVGSEHWVVLDYGGLIVHIMKQEARKFYSLEKLWEKTKRVPWEKKERKILKKPFSRVSRAKTGTKKSSRKLHS